MKQSIFTRLFVSHIAVILVSVAALGLLMSFLIRGYVIEKKRSELLEQGSSIAAILSASLIYEPWVSADVLYKIKRPNDESIWIVDQRGNLLAGRPPHKWANRTFPENSNKIKALFSGTPQSWVRTARQQTDPSIVVALPVPDTKVPTALFIYSPISGIDKAVRALNLMLLYSLLLGLLIAAIVGFFMARSLTRPIADISRAADEFAKGNFTSRTTATGHDEIGRLGRTFNLMATSIANIEQNRREFLANVTHELKTPVAAIQALAETILDGLASKPEQRERYLTTIVSETAKMNRMINDLLDMAQIEAGELNIAIRPLNLNDFWDSEQNKYTAALTTKNLKLHTDMPVNLPLVLTDPDRLSQIFNNLVSNAIRHAPENSTIAIRVIDLTDAIEISIIDSGPGIAARDLDYIWDRFYRVDKARSRKEGGTGLGLAITKKLVEAMNGQIRAASIPGEGAQFTFSLPVAKEPA